MKNHKIECTDCLLYSAIGTSIEMEDTESLEDRVAALEAMLDEATNLSLIHI